MKAFDYFRSNLNDSKMISIASQMMDDFQKEKNKFWHKFAYVEEVIWDRSSSLASIDFEVTDMVRDHFPEIEKQKKLLLTLFLIIGIEFSIIASVIVIFTLERCGGPKIHHD